jgi:hypothetical protein
VAISWACRSAPRHITTPAASDSFPWIWGRSFLKHGGLARYSARVRSWSMVCGGMAAGGAYGAGPIVMAGVLGSRLTMTICSPGRMAAPGRCFSSAWSEMARAP